LKFARRRKRFEEDEDSSELEDHRDYKNEDKHNETLKNKQTNNSAKTRIRFR